MQQLDLFADSRDVILRNETIAALRAEDWSAAYQGWAKLRAEYANDVLLGPMKTLLDALTSPLHGGAMEADAEEMAAALTRMEQLIVPAALRVFGGDAALPWLAVFWRALAESVAGWPYRPDSPQLHGAAFWLRAREWEAAATAVTTIPSWRRIPQPLAWMCRARLASQGLAATWPLLVELAWLHPAGFGALVPQLDTPVLLRLLRRFEAEFAGEDDAATGEFEPEDGTRLAWFPAWALTAEPGLAAVVRLAEVSADAAPIQAARLLLQLLILEREGRHGDVVAARKRLRQLHAGLFACYMRSRE
jgi:hypothetical protein